jgi:hypothetical protein
MLDIPIRRLVPVLLLTLTAGCEAVEGDWCDDTFTFCEESNQSCYLCDDADDSLWIEGRCATSHEAAQAFCGGTGTTSGGGSCGNTPYTGPTGDPQSDSFCKAAYNYKCSGDTQKVQANCAIYRQMQADNPGMPNCPYCQ